MQRDETARGSSNAPPFHTDLHFSDTTLSQFRSFEFIPRLARWLFFGVEIPSEDYDLVSIPDAPHAIWWVDNFGNCKTTLLPEDVSFVEGETVKTTVGDLPSITRLRDVVDGQSAVVIGSSGIGQNRFLEIVVQGKSAAQKFNLSSGSAILSVAPDRRTWYTYKKSSTPGRKISCTTKPGWKFKETIIWTRYENFSLRSKHIPSMKTPSLQELLEAGVHFGHQVNRWHPHMEPYIFTARENIHIIDLLKTKELLELAANYLKEQAKAGKVIMFVGTKHQAQDIIKEEAERVGAAYISKRWIGGLLTNWEQIKRNVDKLNAYERDKDTKKLDQYTKKERLLMDRKMVKLNSELSGIKHLTGLPDVLFLIDPKREMNAVLEAKRKGITVVALCDTNTNPQLVDYVIPGNDDSIKSLRLIIKTVADAIEQGRGVAEKSDKKQVTSDKPEVDEVVVANVEEVVKEVVEEVEGVIKDEAAEEDLKNAAVIEKEMASPKEAAKKPAAKKTAKKSEKVKEVKVEVKAKVKGQKARLPARAGKSTGQK